MPRNALPILLLASALAACGGAEQSPSASGAAAVALTPAGETPPPAYGTLANAGFWHGTGSGEGGLIFAAAGLAGVTIHAPDGRQLGALEGVEAGLLTVVPPRAGASGPQVVVYDSAAAALELFTLEGNAPDLVKVTAEPLTLEDEATGLCHYRSRLSGADYVYAVTDAGLVLHFELYDVGGRTAGRLLRTIPVGKGAGYCAVDPATGTLYVSEEEVGIWRMGAEPESDTTRTPLALAAPWGDLSDEVKGIAVYRDGDQAWLVVADVGENRLAVLDAKSGSVAGRATVEGLGEAEGIAAVTSFGDAWPDGLLAIADEDAEDGSNVKLVDWRALAAALELPKGRLSATEASPPATVRPVLETEIAASYGDAADDPAIWVHPDDPEKSLVIGTDKKLGLYVFDLEGRTLQTVPDGRMNNVDLRDGFPLGDSTVTLVTASNRSDDSIAVYRLDTEAARLIGVAAATLPTGFDDPYGLCMYRSAASGEYYVFVNANDDGTFRQWRLYDDGQGRVAAERVREFAVGSQAEGCVADDATGALYVNEEDVGLWKYSAEPDGGDARTAIDAVGDGRLVADVEGVALWSAPDGGGYIVVSNQGADNYVLYERGGEHAYAGTFHVIANPEAGVDGASETDGLDVTSAPLGARFPQGLLVVQDGRNIAPEERQNFKFISWADVAHALKLPGAPERAE